ncbi:suppressor of cytokine signaling 7 isoform X2 [Maylandia zebra]|uniref:Suppressor of cytokine signaling 7 n=1 Tax=Astatotilapia calliptera TaxID=8154 RepID=A0A3P8Q5X6_ASTCA|nr:suppressor of cytokine signaling 7 isoform X2 [Maylandia zebra]XP_026027879.1 suppressor of cytokine signaling 7 isoform X2 [Astatotilapia calliptera]
MNNAQDMSPDFVLMRLVSVAEDDRLDAENGNLPPGGVVAGLGKEVLAHSGVKAGLDISRDPTEGLQHPSSHLNKAQPSTEGTAAPDSGVTESRATLSAPPPPQSSMEAQGFDFAPSPGLRPQLLVFSNIMRNGEGILELDRRNQPRDALDQSPGSGCSSPAVNNNTLSVREVQQQQQNLLDRTWGAHSPASVEMQGAAELCHRHRLIATTPEWPVLTERSNPLTVIDSKWGCATRDREGAVFELARRFGELGVGAVPKMLFKAGELPHCSCQSAHRPAGGGVEPGDDPTETSDALLVLEGLGNGDVDGLDMDECPEDEADDENGRREFLLNRKREIVQKMSGAFSISSFQVELRRQVEETATEAAAAAHIATQVCSLHGNLSGRLSQVSCGNTEVVTHASAKSSSTTPAQSSPWATSPNLSQASTPRRRPERCASAPRTPTGRATGGEKMLKVPGKSKKGSLKIRLSKLFRTKSCSGSSHLLDKRPSVTYSVSSAGSLVDMACAAGAEQDADNHSQPRLTRAHSAFSPASLSASLSTFTGETVSLVDVDISRRGANTPHPHPPTPPPPPRRSLSLLDAFLRALPHSNPSSADGPPPIRQAPPPMLCALRRSEASNFTASLRELEKCGWYWGPMNWEDAEMKLKGKPDGSFLVRDSSDPRYILSLSFRSQGVTHHTRMEHYRGTFSLWCHPKFEDRCHSVVEFIERAIMHSKNGKFLYFLRSRVPGLPPTPVQLLYPVSRFSNVKSLQHLCRFCIRQIVRIDHIQELPLPRPLISYLSKFYYYDPEEEMYLSIKSIRRVVGVGQEAESQT